ncbi:hypothetical protein Baya_16290 [Bagarius yarrelli]|uniref:Uncharacterized protein n=1 Tax=Bagarius yarrelli TaxID=175774 RepID=A0A556VUX0_BAGYA|nr:hypothetical protein Baya_16290 [Bagarius yarrelli]
MPSTAFPNIPRKASHDPDNSSTRRFLVQKSGKSEAQKKEEHRPLTFKGEPPNAAAAIVKDVSEHPVHTQHILLSERPGNPVLFLKAAVNQHGEIRKRSGLEVCSCEGESESGSLSRVEAAVQTSAIC